MNRDTNCGLRESQSLRDGSSVLLESQKSSTGNKILETRPTTQNTNRGSLEYLRIARKKQQALGDVIMSTDECQQAC